jgi:hypothetical protein
MSCREEAPPPPPRRRAAGRRAANFLVGAPFARRHWLGATRPREPRAPQTTRGPRCNSNRSKAPSAYISVPGARGRARLGSREPRATSAERSADKGMCVVPRSRNELTSSGMGCCFGNGQILLISSCFSIHLLFSCFCFSSHEPPPFFPHAECRGPTANGQRGVRGVLSRQPAVGGSKEGLYT